jgi:hypothetical protein
MGGLPWLGLLASPLIEHQRCDDMGIIFILGGIAAALIGVFGKKFYEGDALTLSGHKRERRVSTWYGRLIFMIVCVFFIAAGTKFLSDGTSWLDK